MEYKKHLIACKELLSRCQRKGLRWLWRVGILSDRSIRHFHDLLDKYLQGDVWHHSPHVQCNMKVGKALKNNEVQKRVLKLFVVCCIVVVLWQSWQKWFWIKDVITCFTDMSSESYNTVTRVIKFSSGWARVPSSTNSTRVLVAKFFIWWKVFD